MSVFVVLDREGQEQDVQQRVSCVHELYMEHGAFIKSVINYAVSGDKYSEDLFGDIFLHFIAKPIPENVNNIRGYIYKVVIDKVRDWQRSDKRYRKKIRLYTEHKVSNEAQVVCTDNLNSIQAKEMFALIEKHLTDKQAKAIRLHYDQSIEVDKIAEIMQMHPRSVNRYLSMGLKKMRAIMKSKEKE